MQVFLIQNYGAYFDTLGAGITGPVLLKGSQNGSTIDLSSRKWTYQVIGVNFRNFFVCIIKKYIYLEWKFN